MKSRFLLLHQLNAKLTPFYSLKDIVIPHIGWIKTVRTALGMTLEQLGKQLNVSKQAVLDMERREKEGAITLKALQEIAGALDMKLVYGFVPKDGTIENLIERRAEELAAKIVSRAAHTMYLEDQGITDERIQKAIKERAELLKKEMPKILWD